MSQPPEGPPSLWKLPEGWSLRYERTTESTNDDAKRAALDGCPELMVFLAEEQREGRGRLGRRWVSPPGANLLFSIVLRRTLPPIYLTAMCSVSVAEAITGLTGRQALVKWPNDVMLNDRKLCGVLTEVAARGPHSATVVGIGLNVNVDPVAAGLPPNATSLAQECGQWFARGAVLGAILQRIDDYLVLPAGSAVSSIREKWETLLWGREQVVRVDDAGSSIEGVVIGLSAGGSLRIRTRSGAVQEVSVGDLSLAT